MRWGTINSGILHGSVLLLSLGVLPSILPDPDIPVHSVPVDLLTIDEITNVKRMEKSDDPKPEPEKAAEPEPAPQAVNEPAMPEPPKAEAPPEPAPPPEPQKLAEAIPLPTIEKTPEPPAEQKPVETAEASPKVKPKPPAPAKKKENNLDQIAALLNKIPDTKHPDNAGEKAPPTAAEQTTGAGAQTALTVSEIDALRAQMQRCWTPPAGAPNPEALIVKVRVWFNPDGSLGRAPEVQRQAFGDPFSQIATEAALRAVRLCAPYKMPVEKYSSWRELDLNFDPRDMLGG